MLCRELHSPLREVLDLDFSTAMRLADGLDAVERRRRVDYIVDVAAAASSVMDGGKVCNQHIQSLTKKDAGENQGGDITDLIAAFGMGV